MLPLKSPFPTEPMKAETTSKQPEPNFKLQRRKQKEAGNDNLLISVNGKTFKLTQKVHGTPFSNLLKALMDTTKHSNRSILQMKENANILSKHYCKVFNQNAPYDPTITDKIDQNPQANPALGIAPNMKEIKTIINKMKNNKAPGITGVTTDMLKNLPDEALKFLTDITQNYWDNPNTDFPSWHATKLRLNT